MLCKFISFICNLYCEKLDLLKLKRIVGSGVNKDRQPLRRLVYAYLIAVRLVLRH